MKIQRVVGEEPPASLPLLPQPKMPEKRTHFGKIGYFDRMFALLSLYSAAGVPALTQQASCFVLASTQLFRQYPFI